MSYETDNAVCAVGAMQNSLTHTTLPVHPESTVLAHGIEVFQPRHCGHVAQVGSGQRSLIISMA